jgi:hypothetical protein
LMPGTNPGTGKTLKTKGNLDIDKRRAGGAK